MIRLSGVSRCFVLGDQHGKGSEGEGMRALSFRLWAVGCRGGRLDRAAVLGGLAVTWQQQRRWKAGPWLAAAMLVVAF